MSDAQAEANAPDGAAAQKAGKSYNPQIPLVERALLVRLTRKVWSPYARDDTVVDKANARGIGNFNKHLFKDKNSRVAKTNQKFSEIYEYHRDHTVPWVDNGPRMIRTDAMQEYKQEMRKRIAAANEAVDDLVANWDDEVQRDLDRIRGINPELAKPADYPSRLVIKHAYDAQITFMPVPDEEDFRIGMDAEDIQRLRDAADEAERNATTHVIQQLLEPLQAAAEKLKVEIGEDGSVFRDSLTKNIIEVATRMEKVNLSTDPRIAKMIKYVRDLGKHADDKKDALRSSPEFREKAADKVEETIKNITSVMDGMA